MQCDQFTKFYTLMRKVNKAKKTSLLDNSLIQFFVISVRYLIQFGFQLTDFEGGRGIGGESIYGPVFEGKT